MTNTLAKVRAVAELVASKSPWVPSANRPSRRSRIGDSARRHHRDNRSSTACGGVERDRPARRFACQDLWAAWRFASWHQLLAAGRPFGSARLVGGLARAGPAWGHVLDDLFTRYLDGVRRAESPRYRARRRYSSGTGCTPPSAGCHGDDHRLARVACTGERRGRLCRGRGSGHRRRCKEGREVTLSARCGLRGGPGRVDSTQYHNIVI